MINEPRPYPGFSAMLEEFQDLFADWVLAGYPATDCILPGGERPRRLSVPPHYNLYLSSSNSARIQIAAQYAKKPGFIFSSSTIDTSAVASFCQRNHLEYRIISVSDLPETLLIFGTPQNFLNSELNGKLVRSRQRAQSLVPLAQKFYQWEQMKHIHTEIKSFEHTRTWAEYPKMWVSDGGVGFETDPNKGLLRRHILYIFHEHSYRNLQSNDEIIAFTLALYAHTWHTEPRLLDWNKLIWNINIDEGRMLENMPRYNVHCPYTDPPRKPQPTPQPTYKDFF